MDYVVVFLIAVGLTMFGMSFAIDAEYRAGAIAVASGQWKCELTEKEDKTTHWVCEKVKK